MRQGAHILARLLRCRYNNGKVCLSLLGTWAGPSWQPGQSTLLQVLVSIQVRGWVRGCWLCCRGRGGAWSCHLWDLLLLGGRRLGDAD